MNVNPFSSSPEEPKTQHDRHEQQREEFDNREQDQGPDDDSSSQNKVSDLTDKAEQIRKDKEDSVAEKLEEREKLIAQLSEAADSLRDAEEALTYFKELAAGMEVSQQKVDETEELVNDLRKQAKRIDGRIDSISSAKLIEEELYKEANQENLHRSIEKEADELIQDVDEWYEATKHMASTDKEIEKLAKKKDLVNRLENLRARVNKQAPELNDNSKLGNYVHSKFYKSFVGPEKSKKKFRIVKRRFIDLGTRVD